MHITPKELNKIGPEYKDVMLTKFRDDLLEIFDVYEKDVLRGRSEETIDEHLQANEWLKRLRDKDETALTDIPKNIVKYHKKAIEKVIHMPIEEV
jgi:hypothetical protein